MHLLYLYICKIWLKSLLADQDTLVKYEWITFIFHYPSTGVIMLGLYCCARSSTFNHIPWAYPGQTMSFQSNPLRIHTCVCVCVCVCMFRGGTYIGISSTRWKLRFNNHIHSFSHERLRNQTALSKHFWKLKNKFLTPEIQWSILKGLILRKALMVDVVCV